jgi:hypothetical protein
VARRVFFSFHYERDIWRANVVRKSWVVTGSREAEFIDASLWEKAKTQGPAAVKKLIDDGLKNTSVTAVLIGKETASRDYVKYEIERSIAEGKGLFGVRIEKIENQQKQVDDAGPNPLPSGYKIHLWNKDEGYKNFGAWVEAAAKEAGR